MRQLKSFLDMESGDIVKLISPPDVDWVFWMDEDMRLFNDAGQGAVRTSRYVNHWLDDDPMNLRLVAEGVDDIEKLREWEASQV